MRTQTAGLRCGRLWPADVCDVDCKLLYYHTAYRDAACEGARYAGLRQGEAAARRWLAPSPFGHGIDSSVRSRAEGSAQALRRNAALRQWAAAGCRAYVRAPEFTTTGCHRSNPTLPSAARCGERHTPFKRRSASGWDNAVHRLPVFCSAKNINHRVVNRVMGSDCLR